MTPANRRRRCGAARTGIGITVVALLMGNGAVLAVEVGPNDFRISEAGPDGDASYATDQVDVAYNSVDDVFLVVWHGNDDILAPGEFEIFGRLVSRDGIPIGPQVRISDMENDAGSPAVAHNTASNEFLVVWAGDDVGETEIYGQRLSGGAADPVGSDDFRISDVGTDGVSTAEAASPAVAYNPVNDRYLVVWTADEAIAPLVDDEFEVYGELLSAGGGLVGLNDFRISDMGPDGDPTYRAEAPAVAHNTNNGRFLVVWSGIDDTAPGESEIFGQLLTGATVVATGDNDFRITTMGPDGDVGFAATDPAVTFSPASGDFLAAWRGSDAVAGEYEIYAQRITASGGQNGEDDFRISSMGPDGNPGFAAGSPDVAYNRFNDEYLVVWEGNDTAETEIHGQRLRGNAAAVGVDDFRVSDMGPDGNAAYGGFGPALAHANPFLVAWRGVDGGSLAANETEVYGQLVETAADTVGLVDPAQGFWRLRSQAGVETSFYYGNPGDFPIMGDWDCDGIDTPGMYRQADGYVYLSNSNTQGLANIRFFFGNPGDVPIAGDFDADGCDTVSIYRPSEGRFFIINALGRRDGGLGAAELDYLFGNPGDKPFIGDFNADGVDTVGLHRESTGFVYFRQTHTQGVADSQFFFGDPGDRLVAGDWGIVDGTDTPAVYRPANTTFYFRHTNTQGNADSTLVFGQPPWLPVAGTFGLD